MAKKGYGVYIKLSLLSNQRDASECCKNGCNSVPHEGIDAVGVERTIPENPLRRKSDQKHWYIAIVNNKSEKLCRDKLEKRIASQPEGEKDYEVYIASQKEMCLLPSGKRKQVDRIVFPFHCIHPLHRCLA